MELEARVSNKHESTIRMARRKSKEDDDGNVGVAFTAKGESLRGQLMIWGLLERERALTIQ